MDSFTCIFQGFQYLIDFALSVNNQMNKANKNQSTMKKYEKQGTFGCKLILYILKFSGLAVSKMPHVWQSHTIKHVLYYERFMVCD